MQTCRIHELYPEVKDYYFIDECGRVYSEYSNRYLTPCASKTNSSNNYFRVSLQRQDGSTNQYAIHRMLMMAFRPVENMENLQVNHKDGNKQNNSFDNLEWVTVKENINHAWKNGLSHARKKEASNFSKLTQKDVDEIFKMRGMGYTQQQIADTLNKCTRSNISHILNNKSWKE